MMKKFTYALLASVFISPAVALAAADHLDDLGNLSLENLGNVVTSVSKKPEDSFRSAAAIYVITNEDIKLSGATHIAEVLRGVPGLDVAQIDSSDWAITSRGFNGEFSNKLLVLVDGRTIYTPIFSGVYWDIQNMPLDDIERIEVIRGPGAALWGSNAVNGIINIITKDSAATQGAYANQIVGNQDKSLTDLRYGNKFSDNAYYRVYAKHDERDPLSIQSGGSADNRWESSKTGFRTDFNASDTSKVTIQGDAYRSFINLDLSVPDLVDPSGYNSYHDKLRSEGFNVLGKWQEKHSNDLQSTYQAYVDYQSPSYSVLKQEIYTFDYDYQTSWNPNERNAVVWGAGARDIEASLTGSFTAPISESHVDQQIYNIFIQDQIALSPKEVYLTLGTKLEYNSFVGWVPEPSARISWYPSDKQTVWGAISRAVRTPSIFERTASLNQFSITPGLIAQVQGNSDFDSEELTAYEIGYRIKPTQKVSIDNTAFINEYTRLETFEPGATIGGGTIQTFVASNLGAGHAYGFETSAKWDVTNRWNLLANYSYINMILDQGDSLDTTFMGQKGLAPHNQAMLRSQLFLPHDVQLVNSLYYTQRLPTSGIQSYVRFDTQAIWQPMTGVELALVGQNLLDNTHPEFGASLNGAVNEIPRAVYGRVTLRY